MTYFPKPPTAADGTILAVGPRLADRRVLQSTGEHPAPCARHCEANAFRIELRNKDACIAEFDRVARDQAQRLTQYHDKIMVGLGRIAELQEELDSWIHTNAIDVMQRRIAELEKQAALDKSLLALADMRINRELRDDFAGRAMQGLISSGGWIDAGQAADEAHIHADAMLKAKGGA